MTILEFEKKVFSKYGAVKVQDLSSLKTFLTHQPQENISFSPEVLTENEIQNNEFYAAYVFDEKKLTKRKVLKPLSDSGWQTTIIFLAVQDGVNIEEWFMHDSNSLTVSEIKNFLLDVGLYKIKRPTKVV